MDGLNCNGPFVITIKNLHIASGRVVTSYRQFDSLSAARAFVYAGTTLLRDSEDVALTSSSPESLSYTTKRRKVTLYIEFNRGLAEELNRNKG